MAALTYCALSLISELYDFGNAFVRHNFDYRRTVDYLRVVKSKKLFYRNCREVWLRELEKCGKLAKLNVKVQRILSNLPTDQKKSKLPQFLYALSDYFYTIENMKRAGIDFATIEVSKEAYEAAEEWMERRNTGENLADFMKIERSHIEELENFDDIEIVHGQELQASFYEYADTLPILRESIPTLEEGVSFTFTGYTLPNCERFSINFITENDDVALHINPRLPQNYIVRNTKVGNTWAQEEVASPLPFTLNRGASFTIQVLVTTENYMISINGYHFAKYYHRLPYTDVTDVEVKGDVEKVKVRANKVDSYPAILPETEAKTIRVVNASLQDNRVWDEEDDLDLNEYDGELDNSFPRVLKSVRTLNLPNIVASMQRVAMHMPYYGNVPIGSLVEGARLVIEGRIKLLPHSFYINLQNGQQIWPHPIIAFHFNPRFSKQSGAIGKAIVCRNAWYNGMWAEEERSELDTDLRPGKAFCLSIYCSENSFKVFVNHKFITKFTYHMDPKVVDIVYIQGDIKIWDVFLEQPKTDSSTNEGAQ